MVIYTNMILTASQAMTYYHYPLKLGQINTLSMQSSYLWLVIEQLVFISLLLSNIVYVCIRCFCRNKLQLDMKDPMRQLPNQDTVIATAEVVNAFNA